MHQNERSQHGTGKREAGVLLFIARALACSLEVFLHKSDSFGERYLGAQATAAMGIMFVFPIFAERQDPTDLYVFLAVFVVGCMAVRSGTLARRRRGELGPHSYYTGTPRILGRSSEQIVKGTIEPVVTWIVALVLSELSPLLASYLAVAAAGLLVSVQLTLAAERKRLVDMHDAFMEQRDTAERWRAMHRDP